MRMWIMIQVLHISILHVLQAKCLPPEMKDTVKNLSSPSQIPVEDNLSYKKYKIRILNQTMMSKCERHMI